MRRGILMNIMFDVKVGKCFFCLLWHFLTEIAISRQISLPQICWRDILIQDLEGKCKTMSWSFCERGQQSYQLRHSSLTKWGLFIEICRRACPFGLHQVRGRAIQEDRVSTLWWDSWTDWKPIITEAQVSQDDGSNLHILVTLFLQTAAKHSTRFWSRTWSWLNRYHGT